MTVAVASVQGGIWITGAPPGGRLEMMLDERSRPPADPLDWKTAISMAVDRHGERYVLAKSASSSFDGRIGRRTWVAIYLPRSDRPAYRGRVAYGRPPRRAAVLPAPRALRVVEGPNQITAIATPPAATDRLPALQRYRYETREALPAVGGSIVRAVATLGRDSSGAVLYRYDAGEAVGQRFPLTLVRRGTRMSWEAGDLDAPADYRVDPALLAVDHRPAYLTRVLCAANGYLELQFDPVFRAPRYGAGPNLHAFVVESGVLELAVEGRALTLTGGAADPSEPYRWRPAGTPAVVDFFNAAGQGGRASLTLRRPALDIGSPAGDLRLDGEVQPGQAVTTISMSPYDGRPLLRLRANVSGAAKWSDVVGAVAAPAPVEVAVLFESGLRHVFAPQELWRVDDAQGIADWRAATPQAAMAAEVEALAAGSRLALSIHPAGSLSPLPDWSAASGPTSDHTFGGLAATSIHSVRAAARNAAGLSPWIASFGHANAIAAPRARDVRVASGRGRAFAWWAGPQDDEELDEMQLLYRARTRDADGAVEGAQTLLAGSLASRHRIGEGLADGAEARFRVRAVGPGGATAGAEQAIRVGRTDLGGPIPEDVDEDDLA